MIVASHYTTCVDGQRLKLFGQASSSYERIHVDGQQIVNGEWEQRVPAGYVKEEYEPVAYWSYSDYHIGVGLLLYWSDRRSA